MIEISFLAAEALLAALWLLARIGVWIRQGHIAPKRELALVLMYINLAVILRFTFFPMARLDGRVQPLIFDAAALFPLRVDLVPLAHLLDYGSRRDLILNLAGNVGLFLPSGILFPALYRRLDGFWKVLATGALLSLCIEVLQLPFSVRATDVNDLILNTLGIAIGYGIYACFAPLRHGRPDLVGEAAQNGGGSADGRCAK